MRKAPNMKKMLCIIVDDEPLARELLAAYIGRLRHWELLASCRNVAEAYEALYQERPDVIFLDINMPDRTGIEFLATLKNPPHVIFTTAYAEYAATAFDLHAVDYLVKPISEPRFLEAVAKAERLLPSHLPPDKTADHLFLKQDSKLVKIAFEDIIYVEALKDFSKVFLKDRVLLAGTHLKGMEEQLPALLFVRIHRSYLVALDKITAIQGNMVELGKQSLPIGDSYKEALMVRLGLGLK